MYLINIIFASNKSFPKFPMNSVYIYLNSDLNVACCVEIGYWHRLGDILNSDRPAKNSPVRNVGSVFRCVFEMAGGLKYHSAFRLHSIYNEGLQLSCRTTELHRILQLSWRKDGAMMHGVCFDLL